MSTHDYERPRYMLSVAAELVGMHPQTLRIYENKGLVRPGRTPGGTRLYSEHDLDRLGWSSGFTEPAPAGRRRSRDRSGGRAAQCCVSIGSKQNGDAIGSRHRQYRRDLVVYREGSPFPVRRAT
jgi:hypothetical protein